MRVKNYLLIIFVFIQAALFSQQGTHLNFDGFNDDIVLPANIGNTLSNGTELTIEYWFKGTNVQSAVRIQNGAGYIVAGWGASNNPQFIVSTDGGTSGVSCGPSVVDNTWHHLAFVWKKNDIFATYLDGILQDSRTAANVNLPIFSGDLVRIGSFNGASEFIRGNIDDVRIWNVAKSSTQINASKNCELQGNETGLLAYYKFNQGTGAANNVGVTTLTDATSNGFNGSLINFSLTGITSNWLAGSLATIPPTVTPTVIYNQGTTASALTATVGANGTGLLWYTSATGGTGSTIAPTPSTTNPGTTSYWVSSTNANGCESARAEIVVIVYVDNGCWSKISSGHGNHTLAIKLDGTLWAWGANTNGQLGDGTNTDKNIPVQIGTDTNWSVVSAGENHSLALKSDGTLWAWGYNAYGQLGDGTTVDKNIPTQIGTSISWTKIAAGGNHSLGMHNNKVNVWGNNAFGQLWLTTSVQLTPFQLGYRSYIDIIAAGKNHSIMGTNGRTDAFVTGLNANGQLGLGNTNNVADSSFRSVIRFNLGVVAISLGGAHSLVILSDGSLWSFGANIHGQLGDGTTTDKLTPIRIGTDTDWASISAGGNHTIARKTNGTLWTWGFNNNGQLGDGTNTNKNIPIQIGTGTTWSSIAAADNHSVALQSNSSFWVWGLNQVGQLGDGTTVDKIVPTAIECLYVLSSDDFIAENNVTIYPNPSNGIFTIDAKEAVTVEVYDMIGKKVFNSKVALGSSNFDLSNHSNGIYLLMVTNLNGNKSTYKLIKK
ncbi:LamG-like jellyroll fold domain-containing protein [Flavobacterium lacisediminis]|uniref:T9SS type A sorting domain-containing protein n=1 Tax=Flavobacterium lacisediminis TaxID=2989705 RepID=A0ABT3EG82_9FLAO|nr:LamG-like jellyroll fold domain-containing protein [Flavobacterium lacisediminis]MCW1147585.1 T9SS type A sorting domain-containing protein [Flavobacterium lacisediminis]